MLLELHATCVVSGSVTAIILNLRWSTMTKADETVDLFNKGFICSQVVLSALHKTVDSNEIRHYASRGGFGSSDVRTLLAF